MTLFEAQEPYNPHHASEDPEWRLWGAELDRQVTDALTKHAEIVQFDSDDGATDMSAAIPGCLPSHADRATLHLRDRTIDEDNKHRSGAFMLDIYITAQATQGPDETMPIIRLRPAEGTTDPLAEIVLERVESTGGVETVDEACMYAIETDYSLNRVDIPFHDGVPNYLRFMVASPLTIERDIQHMYRLSQLVEADGGGMPVGAQEAAFLSGLLALGQDPRVFDS